MSYFFSPSQIAELAVRTEEKGAEFYAALARINGDETMRKLFDFLSLQEGKHREIFQKMARDAQQQTEMEYSIDVQSMLRNSQDELQQAAFSISRLNGADLKGLESFFAIALNTEETSIMIYEGIKRSYSEKFSSILNSIIEEEKRHKSILLDVQKKILR